MKRAGGIKESAWEDRDYGDDAQDVFDSNCLYEMQHNVHWIYIHEKTKKVYCTLWYNSLSESKELSHLHIRIKYTMHIIFIKIYESLTLTEIR